jgi:hypothetical protein
MINNFVYKIISVYVSRPIVKITENIFIKIIKIKAINCYNKHYKYCQPKVANKSTKESQ